MFLFSHSSRVHAHARSCIVSHSFQAGQLQTNLTFPCHSSDPPFLQAFVLPSSASNREKNDTPSWSIRIILLFTPLDVLAHKKILFAKNTNFNLNRNEMVLHISGLYSVFAFCSFYDLHFSHKKDWIEWTNASVTDILHVCCLVHSRLSCIA